MDQKDVINTVKKYIAFLREKEIPVKEAYIFGSYARGNVHKDSDIDIAVVIEGLQKSSLSCNVILHSGICFTINAFCGFQGKSGQLKIQNVTPGTPGEMLNR